MNKKAFIVFLSIIILLSLVTYAFAGIGYPSIDLGYQNLNTAQTLISVVPMSLTQPGSDLYIALEVSSATWEPIWLNIPLSRYWFDGTASINILKPREGFNDYIFGLMCSFIANIIFTVSIWLTRFSIELILLAFNTQILMTFLTSITTTSTDIWNGNSSTGTQGIRNTILLIILVMTSFYYILKLAQTRFSDIIRSIGITILVLGLSYAYFANIDKLIPQTVKFANSLTSVAFSVIPEEENNTPVKNPQQRGIINFCTETWKLLVVTPWAYGNFGTADISKNQLEISPMEYKALKNELSKDAADKLKPDHRLDQILLALPVGTNDRNAAVDVFASQEIDHGDNGDNGGHKQTTTTLHLNSMVDCIFIAILSIVGALIFFLFCLIVTGMIIMADIVLMIGLTIAPFIAVAALVPETGWKILLSWLKTMLAALFTKAFYGIYLGIVCVVLSVILNTENLPFLFQLLLVSLTLVCAIIYRGKVINKTTELANLNKENSDQFFKKFIKFKLAIKAIKSIKKLIK